MTTGKYDVEYANCGNFTATAIIVPHYCTEITIDSDGEQVGCYGTNPNHGLSWEEARQEIVEHYQSLVDYYKALTYEEWKNGS